MIDQSPIRVGTKLPNPWGLHDTYGNVGEWCQDIFDENYYVGSLSTDSKGPCGKLESSRVAIGVYLRYFTRHSRSSSRNTRRPNDRQCPLGFCLVKT